MKKSWTVLMLACLVGGSGVAFAGNEHSFSQSVDVQVVRDHEPPRGFLGVTLSSVRNTDVGKEENGVYVQRVIEGGAAEAAGLRAQDRLVAIDGTPTDTLQQLHELLGRSKPQDRVTVTVERDGREEVFDVTLGEVPHGHSRWAVVVDEKRAFLGVHVQPLSHQLADYFQVDGGLLITDVSLKGPAKEAGLLAGDVLVEVEGQRITDRKSLHHAMADVEPGAEVAVVVQRRGAPVTAYVETVAHPQQDVSFGMDQLHELIQTDPEGNVEIIVPGADDLHFEVRPDASSEDR